MIANKSRKILNKKRKKFSVSLKAGLKLLCRSQTPTLLAVIDIKLISGLTKRKELIMHIIFHSFLQNFVRAYGYKHG